jgi:hypothetical protein
MAGIPTTNPAALTNGMTVLPEDKAPVIVE